MNLFAVTGLSVGVSCTLLAGITFIFGKNKLHRLLSCFNLVVAIWGIGLFLVGIAPDYSTVRVAWRIAHVGGFLIGPVFFHLMSTFCERKQSGLILLAYSQAVFFLVLVLFTDFFFLEFLKVDDIFFFKPTALYTIGFLFYLFFILRAYYELIRFLKIAQGNKKTQTLYNLFCFSFGFLGGSATFLPIYQTGYFIHASNFGITIYAFVLSYAIMRHKMMDIRLVLRRTIVYSISACLVTALFVPLVLLLTEIILFFFGYESFFSIALSALIISIVFTPLKEKVGYYVDMLFDKNKITQSQVLNELSEELSVTIQTDEIRKVVVDILYTTLNLQSAFFLKNNFDVLQTAYWKMWEKGKAAEISFLDQPVIPVDPDLKEFLVAGKDIFLRSKLHFDKQTQDPAGIAKILDAYSSEVLVPFTSGQELTGVLILGRKISEDDFSEEDIRLLQTIRNNTSISLQNASLYEQLGRKVKELQHAYQGSNIMNELVGKAKAEWEETFDIINDAITIHDNEFNVIRANKAARELLGLSMRDSLLKKCFFLYHGTDSRPSFCPSCKAVKSGKPCVVQTYEPNLDKYLEIKSLPRFSKNKKITGSVHIVRDITTEYENKKEQEHLQAQLFQSQKMETIGRLAGGVAHDFNNILSIILGYSEMIYARLPEDDPITPKLSIVIDAADKAAALTRQLLAFSRKQVLEMQVVDLKALVEKLSKMLGVIIGEDVEMVITTDKSIEPVFADPGQLEQVLMNLVVNSRDSMPQGGRLTIETCFVELDEENTFNSREQIEPGNYVMLSVSDTGSGMTQEVQEKIFEPFFTTKEKGKGTGLGLATVYGIVKQHNGFIHVVSKVEEGTTFKIFLPVIHKAQKMSEKHDVSELEGGSETILLVEDESLLRNYLVDALRSLGYTVLDAGNGEEALSVHAGYGQKEIHLLLTDVIMPKMNGSELARLITEQRQDMKVLFMSGYTDDAIASYGVQGEGVNFLQKPLKIKNVSSKIRNILDS